MTLVCLDMDVSKDCVERVGDTDYFAELQRQLEETNIKVDQLKIQLSRIESILLGATLVIKRPLSDDY